MDHQLNISEFLKDAKHGTDENLEFSKPIADDKELYTDGTGKMHESDVGDIFESGPRLIDLGKDGKERPIGVYGLP